MPMEFGRQSEMDSTSSASSFDLESQSQDLCSVVLPVLPPAGAGDHRADSEDDDEDDKRVQKHISPWSWTEMFFQCEGPMSGRASSVESSYSTNSRSGPTCHSIIAESFEAIQAIAEARLQRNNSKFKFVCRTCSSTLICSISSSSNLKRHLKRRHPSLGAALTHALELSARPGVVPICSDGELSGSVASSSRISRASASGSGVVKKMRLVPPQSQAVQAPISTFLGPGGRLQWGSRVTQEQLNKKITALVVRRTLAFSLVETTEWKDLMSMLAPDKVLMSRPALMKQIDRMYKEKHQVLKKALGAANIKWCATTADCWTGSNR